MGFIKDSKYGMEIFLTNKGLETFYRKGLKNTALYFTLGSSEGDYREYMNSDGEPLKFVVSDGDFVNGNYVDPVTSEVVTLPQNYLTRMTGKTQFGKVIPNQLFRSSATAIGDLILYYPDVDTNLTYNFESFKEENDHKYFNLASKTPVVLGGVNVGALKHQEDKPNGGYISATEPTFSKPILGSSESPFPGVGVSVSGLTASTEFQKFSILNKSSQTIYLNDYNISKLSSTHTIDTVNLVESSDLDKYSAEYIVKWKNLINAECIDGKLTIRADKLFLNKTKKILLPFEVLEFEAKYEVIDPGNPNNHYHGQTINNKNKKEGELDFTFTVTASKSETATDDLKTNVGIVVQVKDNTKDFSGYDRIACRYYAGESSPCDINSYSTAYVFSLNGTTIKEVYENNGLLKKFANITSPAAISGYYVDEQLNLENPLKPFDAYKWNGSTLAQTYSCIIYGVADIYYTPLTNHYGDFSSYGDLTTIYSDSNYNTLEDFMDNNIGEIYTNNFSKTVIPDGYYTSQLTMPGIVYEFNSANSNKWSEYSVDSIPLDVYASSITNDPTDTRTDKYNSETIHLNSVNGTTLSDAYDNGGKFYTDANCTTLASPGYYANDTTRPFNTYEFDQTILNRIYCDSLIEMSDVYVSSVASGGLYDPASAYVGIDGIISIQQAYEADRILFTSNTGETVIPNGYYITSSSNPPVGSYTAYHFVDEVWTDKVDCLQQDTVYYTASDPMTTAGYAAMTVYFKYATINEAIVVKIYKDYNGLEPVDDGYYSIINPSGGYSYTYHNYSAGEHISSGRHLTQVTGGQIFYSNDDNTGCWGVYSPSTVYAYSETLPTIIMDEVKLNSLALYIDQAGNSEAIGGYYAVNIENYSQTLTSPYTWYAYNNYTHQIVSNYECGTIIAPYPILLSAGDTPCFDNQLFEYYTATEVTSLFDAVKNNIKLYRTKEGSLEYLDNLYFISADSWASHPLPVHSYKYSNDTEWTESISEPSYCDDYQSLTGGTASIACYRNADSRLSDIASGDMENLNNPRGFITGESMIFYKEDTRIFFQTIEGDLLADPTLVSLYQQTKAGTNIRPIFTDSSLTVYAPSGVYKQTIGTGSEDWLLWDNNAAQAYGGNGWIGSASDLIFVAAYYAPIPGSVQDFIDNHIGQGTEYDPLVFIDPLYRGCSPSYYETVPKALFYPADITEFKTLYNLCYDGPQTPIYTDQRRTQYAPTGIYKENFTPGSGGWYLWNAETGEWFDSSIEYAPDYQC